MIKIFRKILRSICFLVLIVSLGVLLKLLVVDSRNANKANQVAQELYYESPKEENRFSSLLELNSDIFGWISIKGTNIDYPVLKSPKDDPDFYLSHNYKKEKSKYGAIFLDFNCETFSKGNKNTILYGHHMADGQMFADLMKFSDVEFYKSHPVIRFDTLNEESNWKIISVFKTNTLSEQGEVFNYTISRFNKSKDFTEYIEEVKKRSLINIPVTAEVNDKLLTLSTCSYEFKDFRTVIVARKVKEEESLEVDTSSAFKSENPLMPQCWYERYGGVAPA